MQKSKWLVLVAVFALFVAACGDDDADTTQAPTTPAPVVTDAPPAVTDAPPAVTDAPPAVTDAPPIATDAPEPENRSIDAPAAAITIDGDVSDWAGIAGLDLTLEQIVGETVDPQDVNVKVAHDAEYLYMLLSVPDDYDFNIDDHHLSPAIGVMWAIDSGAGPHMGVGEEDGEGPSLGMVDIWHWELDCFIGEGMGGAVGGPGDGDPGNDATCNFDDEYSTDPETREDDGGSGAENSLLGVFEHTNPVANGDGTWYFEMSRPFQTGDAQDAQFAVGATSMLALAYWDADFSFEGWDDASHVQSSTKGWIDVNLMAGDITAARRLDAPVAAITVDGDPADWAGNAGLDLTLEQIVGETVDPQDVNVKVAHDAEYLYMLLSVPDDYDFNIDDHKLSPAIGVMWAIDSGAGPHMGVGEEDGEGPSLGMVDIWHWELDCLAGVIMGGAGGPGDGSPGNDAVCNFDDEYSTDPETREDDDGAGAENTLMGTFQHTNPVADGDGTWYFEMARPLQTGDAGDGQFTVGGTSLLALAYWDPDVSFEGWDDATHVQSSTEGWIKVTLLRN